MIELSGSDRATARSRTTCGAEMVDLLFLALTGGFLLGLVALVKGVDRL